MRVVAGVWWHLDPTRWVGITVAVLVATCPCALWLAIPAVNAAAVGALARVGMIPGSNASLEDLANVDHVMFDKTGTLTDGRFALTEAWYAPNFDAAKIQRIAYALEHDSAHPIGVAIAQAFSQAAKDSKATPVRDWENVPGEGVSGWVDGERYWLGTPQFLNRTIGLDALPLIEKGHFSKRSSLSVLADDSQLLAVFACEDSIRVEARGMVENLLAAGVEVSIASGDREQAVLEVAHQLNIPVARSQMSPQDKLASVLQLREQGRRIMVVGDGVNDAPGLQAADVSIAMGEGSTLARVHANWTLLNGQLTNISQAIGHARRARSTMKQNMSWAVGYNLSVLPFAAFGMLEPWQAAIGMSLSSLAVVVNSARLAHFRSHRRCRGADDAPLHPDHPSGQFLQTR